MESRVNAGISFEDWNGDGKKYLHGITTTYGKNQKAEILVVPCVRGSMISPNGFTGGVTASSSSPDIYDYDVEQITPSVSCEIEVDEPEDDEMDLIETEELDDPANLKEMSEEGLLRALMEAQETKK